MTGIVEEVARLVGVDCKVVEFAVVTGVVEHEFVTVLNEGDLFVGTLGRPEFEPAMIADFFRRIDPRRGLIEALVPGWRGQVGGG